ncbi:uncharacterized protein LOC127276917, partial [Leptopilina boulardi]|uniref:uncharacterized protein LOC127276917 n=1 Tax=Leptopilina boulardi TaxID=63433 RepID=UPI0021F5091C
DVRKRWKRLKLLVNGPQDFLELVLALPLLPAGKIENAVKILKSKIKEYDVIYKRKLEMFMKYICRTWVKVADALSVTNLEQRTNNISESFNSRATARFGGIHPNIWTFLEIQKEQYNELRTEVLDKQEEQHNIIKNILQNGFKEMLKNHHEQRLILEAIAKKEQNTSADMQNQHHLMLNDIFEHDEILSKMPFSSDDEINTFDEKLTDKEFKVLTARAYSSLGSTTPKDCVVAMMTKTFKNSVAAGWSWTGRVKGKNDFKVKKNIVCILRSVARRKYGLNTVTENDVKQWCSEWLKHAPKRRNRENEKILRTIQENEALEDLLNTETEM